MYTVQNVRENPSVAIVVWNVENDKGYQLLGVTENVNELGLVRRLCARN